ncbi:hypothetical protein [Hongsoonwoonella zoysiae]|nr:hypothetical protein [Hongsoonwoonella zoysiae]
MPEYDPEKVRGGATTRNHIVTKVLVISMSLAAVALVAVVLVL